MPATTTAGNRIVRRSPRPSSIPDARPPDATSPWRALPVLMIGTFIIVLDFFVVNVALPSLQSELHVGPTAVEWVVAGYSLTFSTLLITAGRLGDRVGRRKVLGAGLALFVLASGACGLATDATTLVVARLAQGVAAALISTSVLAIIGVAFQGPDRARAIGIYGTVMGIAAAGGQLVGGVLIRADIAGLGWRSVFLVNVPIGGVAVALLPRLVPESREPAAGRLDHVGTALVTAGLTAVVLPLLQGGSEGWPAWTIALLAAAPVILAGFVAHERRYGRRGGSPLLDLSLVRQRPLAAGLITQLAFWCGQASFFLVFALYLQLGRGLDAMSAGLVFTILAASYLLASMRAPALVDRHGRGVIGVGALTLATGHALLAVAITTGGTGTALASLVPGLLAVGAGMGLCIVPLTATVLAGTLPAQAGSVSGLLSTMQQVGNTVGVAVTGLIFYGAAGQGYGHAFTVSVVELAVLLVAVAGLSRILPGRPPVAAPAGAPTRGAGAEPAGYSQSMSAQS